MNKIDTVISLLRTIIANQREAQKSLDKLTKKVDREEQERVNKAFYG